MPRAGPRARSSRQPFRAGKIRERTIHVIGTAEMDIVPDEIYVTVNVKEYVKDKKKYTIERVKVRLLE